MSYQNLSVLRSSPTLLSRFIIAVETTATDVFTEPVNTPNHAERLAWAKRVIFDTDKAPQYADRFRRVAVVSNLTLQTEGEAISDAAIQQLVDTMAQRMAMAGL